MSAPPAMTDDSDADVPAKGMAGKDGTSKAGPSAPDDMGFGRVVVQQVRGRFLSRDGVPMSVKYGLGSQRAEKFYLSALNARWPQFVGWLMGTLLLMNGFFAVAYLALGDDALRGTDGLGMTDPFLAAFAFSVGIFTTTGTGSMHAFGSTANWLVVLESFIGPLTLVGASGLLIARLTRPRMRLRFSESMVVAPYEGGRGVMFRMVNVQPGELSDVRVKFVLSRYEYFDGVRERNLHQLELERDAVEFFNLHWTVVHPITATSPLAGMTPESLRESEAEFLIVVSAHEETFSTRVIARTSYVYDEVTWDVKFATIFANGPEGVIAIDVERLDRMDRLPEGATRVPAALETAAA